MDLKDSKEKFERTKMEYQSQFQVFKSTTVSLKQQLQMEQEAWKAMEAKYKKQLKLARQEN